MDLRLRKKVKKNLHQIKKGKVVVEVEVGVEVMSKKKNQIKKK